MKADSVPVSVPFLSHSRLEVAVTAYRAMRYRSVRETAERRRYESHIEPINRLVDELREKRQCGMPYVDARYGGVEAEVLFLFQDPGPGTDANATGSGFLSAQNNDPSAERFLRCLNKVGLAVERVVTWNAYPWMKPGKGLTAKQLEEGGEVLVRLFERLPKLQVVMLMGKKAQECWQRLQRQRPEVTRAYHTLESYHTSGRGITNGGQLASAAEGEDEVCGAMQKALRVIGR